MNVLFAAASICVLAVAASGCQAQTRPGAGARAPLFTPAPGPAVNVGGRLQDIAVGDWNGDGKLDFVTCSADDAVSIMLGDGRGGFAPAPGSPLRVAAHLVAAGDVNNDRRQDLALTHHDSFGVVVLLGAGGGRFAPAPGSPFEAYRGRGPHNHGLTLSDLNSDGNLDITTSNQDDNSVSVLLGDGRGGFAPAPGSPFAVGRSPYPHAVGDLNGDGRLDIAAPNVGGDSLSVLLGDGRGGFAPAPNSPHRVAGRPYYVALGDVNGDGRPDLISTHDDINLMTTLLGDGRGGFAAAPSSPFDLGRRAFKLVAADVNRDGRADIVTGHAGGVAVLLGDGRGGYAHAPGSPYAAGRDPWAVVGDVNGDGRPDIVAADGGSGNITVLLGG